MTLSRKLWLCNNKSFSHKVIVVYIQNSYTFQLIIHIVFYFTNNRYYYPSDYIRLSFSSVKESSYIIMKLYYNLCFIVLILTATTQIVTANEEEEVEHEQHEEEPTADTAEIDCEAVCEELIQPYITEQETYQQEKDVLMKQYEEIFEERDQLMKELQQVREELTMAHTTTNDVRALLETSQNDVKKQYIDQINELQKSMDTTKEEMQHYQKVAQDNQKYMQEYKNQLHSQRDKANKLNIALQEANEKIVELENMTFMKQLQKELQMTWNNIIEYWVQLKKKGKTETDAEF
jgi:chromosome segregation ATPase